MKAITAIEGETLRKYALTLNNPEVCSFPETMLSPREQRHWVQQNQERFSAVITFSPYIISDCSNVLIMDDEDKNINVRHGDSINKLTMSIWDHHTIGTLASAKCEEITSTIASATTDEELDTIINQIYRELGDSIERVMLINHAIHQRTK